MPERPNQHRRPPWGRRLLPLLLAALLPGLASAAPWSVGQRVDEARARAARGDLDGARLLLHDALARGASDDAEARYLLGLVRLEAGDPDGADDLRACLGLDPGGPRATDARYRLAVHALDHGEAAVARALLPALRRAPLDATGRADVALLALRVRVAEGAGPQLPATRVAQLARRVDAEGASLPAPKVARAALEVLRARVAAARARHGPRRTRTLELAEEDLRTLVGLGVPGPIVEGLHTLAAAWGEGGGAADEARALRLDDLALEVALRTGVHGPAEEAAREAVQRALRVR